MKRPLIPFFILSLLIPATVLGAAVLEGELQEDLFFPDGVKVLGVNQPDESQDVGISSVHIDGYGSMIVGSRSTGDFPRILVIGDTTVMSERDWTNYHRKTWWNGVVQSPLPKKLLSLKEVPELHPVLDRGIKLEVVGTYQWGLDNEQFSYSQPIKVALPAEAHDGEKVFMVFQGKDDTWRVNRSMVCTVQNNLCVFDVKSVKAITLVKRAYEVAQAGDDADFWNNVFGDGDSADPDEFFNDLFSDPVGDTSEPAGAPSAAPAAGVVEEPVWEEPEAEAHGGVNYKEYYDSATYQDTPIEEQRHYYLKKLGTNSDDRALLRPEEGLTEEELEKVRAINTGKLSRRLRNDYVPEEVSKEHNSRILDYLLAMRNKFGEGSQQNVFRKVELASAPEEEFNGGMMLPSTGPGLFVVLAIVGFVLMVFGALRRQ